MKDDVVVLLCRSCMDARALSRKDWNLDGWKALIVEKGFLPWLLVEPSIKEQSRGRRVSVDKIQRLEEMWRTDPGATMEDLEFQEKDAGPIRQRQPSNNTCKPPKATIKDLPIER